MQDKHLAIDTLSSMKTSITELTKAATECSDQQLRSTLTQMRNSCEQTQAQFSQMATQKGWYMPSPQAPQNNVSEIRNYYQSGGSHVGAGTFTANDVYDRM